jgi:hypothetical protein
MKRGKKHCFLPSFYEKIERKFKKPIDKPHIVWYNRSTKGQQANTKGNKK